MTLLGTPFYLIWPRYSVSAGAQPKLFQDRGGFVELADYNKLFIKNTRKKGSAGKDFRAFSPRYT